MIHKIEHSTCLLNNKKEKNDSSSIFSTSEKKISILKQSSGRVSMKYSSPTKNVAVSSSLQKRFRPSSSEKKVRFVQSDKENSKYNLGSRISKPNSSLSITYGQKKTLNMKSSDISLKTEKSMKSQSHSNCVKTIVSLPGSTYEDLSGAKLRVSEHLVD